MRYPNNGESKGKQNGNDIETGIVSWFTGSRVSQHLGGGGYPH